MSSIVIGKCHGKNVSIDLDILLTTRALLTADSGGGKTYALKRIVEQAFGKIQILIIDPEGEFSPMREKLDFVLVGKGGETPADVRSAGLVAQTLLKLRASAICDIYEMKPSERHAWVRTFIDALIEAPKESRHPCLVIVDEAHMFCPEHGKGESEAADAMIGLCTRGRKRLLCPLFATQRLATLSKDASSMLLNRMIGPTFEDVNRKRAADVLSITKEEQKEFYTHIQTLEPGNFFCLGRAISKERILAQIGPIETPHGQEALKYEMSPPPATSKIKAMLPKLADLPKEAAEQAKTAAEFKAQIHDLKSQLAQASVKVASRDAALAVAEGKKKGLIDHGYIKNVTQLLREEREYSQKLRDYFKGLFDAIQSQFRTMKLDPPKKPVSKRAWEEDVSRRNTVRQNFPAPIPVREESRPPSTQYAETQRTERRENNGDKLRSGAERMLAALATWSPNGMTEGQMRAHAGLKKSGTFSAYMSDLRKGYIEERGGMVFATQQGLDYCKHIPAAPTTMEEVLAIWNPKLRDGARRMLQVLVQNRGESISKEYLGESAGLQKSGTFSAYLSDLKTARLAVVNRDGTVAANKETLFL